ncbi:LLM class flavin-dependent oxidoreductase [Mesorhizobium shangrilense]|uniref:LLM class flavin-dependent oxidoreductase n=1 Tax=Mesorhizobium shangrilense TaxID=460060 RepID=A0ABV2DN81_9HYPH
MAKSPIILNGFTMNAVSHVAYGLWRHPDDQAYRHAELDYWIELARALEDGGFDCLFIADALGLLDVHGGGYAASLAKGVQSPVNDPLLLVGALAGATSRLGFGVTVSTTYEKPYLLARKFTTLDHLTKGRIAWNVVTSQLDSAARNLGLDKQVAHDERYEIADEFLEVAYKLWQGSWEDGALVRDRGSAANPDGLYTDPSKVHPIGHSGRYFKVPGPHLSEPSPQRVPVLFQAGGSPRGQRFAARHAEVVFIAGADVDGIRRNVAEVKRLARDEGRAPGSIKFISAVSVITDETDAAAAAKLADYRSHYDVEGALVHYSATTGIDFSKHDLDQPIRYTETDSNRSLLRMFDDPSSGRQWTLRQAFSPEGGFGRGKSFVGGPKTVADELEQWLEVTDTDGINLTHVVSPGSFIDFSAHVVPELRRRGRIREIEAPSLRSRLFGRDSRLPADHPGARHDFSQARPPEALAS